MSKERITRSLQLAHESAEAGEMAEALLHIKAADAAGATGIEYNGLLPEHTREAIKKANKDQSTSYAELKTFVQRIAMSTCKCGGGGANRGGVTCTAHEARALLKGCA